MKAAIYYTSKELPMRLKEGLQDIEELKKLL